MKEREYGYDSAENSYGGFGGFGGYGGGQRSSTYQDEEELRRQAAAIMYKADIIRKL